MYLRESRRTNRDGSVVRYLQLAHNERHPVSGVASTEVVCGCWSDGDTPVGRVRG